MTYRFIDESAAPAETTDGPESSAAWVQLRRNAASVAAERRSRVGWTVRADRPLRVCAAWPVSYGPWWIYLSEPCDTLTVQVLLDSVVYSDQAVQPPAGTDALRLHATCCGPDGSYDPPPASDWGSGALVTTATAQAVILTAYPRGRMGWVGVALWVQSTMFSIVETSGNIVAFPGRGSLTVDFGGVVPTIPNPAERAVMIFLQSAASKLPGDPDLGIFQLGYWSTTALTAPAEAVIYTIPPVPNWALTSFSAGNDQVSIMILGVGIISGVSIQAEAPLQQPAESLFYSAEPCQERAGAGLATAINRLASQRVKQIMSHPSRMSQADSNGYVWWYSLDIDTFYQSLATGLVAFPAPSADRKGYRALLSLYLSPRLINPSTGPRSIYTWLRLIDPLTLAENVAGVPVPTLIPTAGDGSWRENPYSPIAHAAWAVQQFGADAWQGEGWLVGREVPWAVQLMQPDFEALMTLEVEVPAADIGVGDPYPLVLEIQAYSESAWGRLYVIAAAMAERALDLEAL